MPQTDKITRLVKQWKKERPDLDGSPMEILGRLFLLSKHLDHHLREVLSTFHLNVGEFDVLAVLRRQGSPFCLSPSELAKESLLSMGAMTNRLDHLEERGLIKRKADPDDRRGLRIVLTAEGRKLVDKAVAARLHEAKSSVQTLSAKDQTALTELLRKLLASFS